MNDETKEILYVLKHIVIGRASRLTCREADKLLDYITNLQQELERVSNLYEAYEEANDLWIKKYEDYKSRCEKAISKINALYSYADNEEYVDNYCKDLLNILQNGSDSQ